MMGIKKDSYIIVSNCGKCNKEYECTLNTEFPDGLKVKTSKESKFLIDSHCPSCGQRQWVHAKAVVPDELEDGSKLVLNKFDNCKLDLPKIEKVAEKAATESEVELK
jgi:hypothetical protein